LQALHLYNEARAERQAEAIERLRLAAEALMMAVSAVSASVSEWSAAVTSLSWKRNARALTEYHPSMRITPTLSQMIVLDS